MHTYDYDFVSHKWHIMRYNCQSKPNLSETDEIHIVYYLQSEGVDR